MHYIATCLFFSHLVIGKIVSTPLRNLQRQDLFTKALKSSLTGLTAVFYANLFVFLFSFTIIYPFFSSLNRLFKCIKCSISSPSSSNHYDKIVPQNHLWRVAYRSIDYSSLIRFYHIVAYLIMRF